MGMVRVLSVPGAPYLVWDQAAAVAGDPEAAAALREAARVVTVAIAAGETVVTIGSEQSSKRVERFDPSARLLVLLPRVAGG